MEMNANTIVVACPVMKNNKNVSMIARSASCFGANKLIITGQNKINPHIARDYDIEIENRRSIIPVISKYKLDGYVVVGLEQHPNAIKLQEYVFTFDKPMLLVLGNECRGIDQDILNCLDDIVEIQLYGKPKSLNVAVAASVFLSEFATYKELCRTWGS